MWTVSKHWNDVDLNIAEEDKEKNTTSEEHVNWSLFLVHLFACKMRGILIRGISSGQ